MAQDRVTIRLDPQSITLSPLDPLVWQPLSQQGMGPAGFCLELLSLAKPAWHEDDKPLSEQEQSQLPAKAMGPLLQALCAPWLDQAEKQSLNELESHLRSALDYPGLSCAQCREQQERGEGAPDCEACPLAKPPAGMGAWLELCRLLQDLPPSASPLAARALPRSLPPRQARLLALRLALITRLLGEKAPRQD